MLKQKKMFASPPAYPSNLMLTVPSLRPHTHRYEGQLGQLQQQTFNMEQAAMTTDNLRNTMATVDAMKRANKEMTKQYGKIDIDKIEVGPPPHLACPFRVWGF